MQAQRASVFQTVMTGMRANAAWLSNSALVSAGLFVSAALGFVYWWLAARFFPPAAVGSASALTSLMGLVAVFGEIGLGTFLVGEARTHGGKEAARLALAALLTCVAASALCAVAAVALVQLFDLELRFLADDPSLIFLLALGCACTAAALVLDQSYIGLLKGHLSLARNIAFSAFKLAFLALLAARAGDLASEAATLSAIVATWVLAALASIAIPLLFSDGGSLLFQRPDFDALIRARRRILSHHLLNVVTLGPGFALPVVVVMTLGPTSNAAFFPLWTILTVLLLAPASLTTVLYTVVSHHRESLAPRLSASLGLSSAAALAVAVIFYFGSDDLLAIFNPAYVAIAGDDLRFLGLGFFAMAVKQHYIAISRLENAMLKGSAVLAAGGIAEIGFAAIGAQTGGLSGFVSGWLAAAFLLAALLSIPLAGALRGSSGKSVARSRTA